MPKATPDLNRATQFLFEVGMLQHTPRSGYFFLGTGKQSVAEHSFRTAIIGYLLASLDGQADVAKTTLMCLIHDICETRTGDLNYVNQQYVDANEKLVLERMFGPLPVLAGLADTLKEYSQRSTPAARLTKDADNLEWILSLKEQVELGNPRATVWLRNAVKRLQTPHAKLLAQHILQSPSDSWYADPDNAWWVERNANQERRL